MGRDELWLVKDAQSDYELSHLPGAHDASLQDALGVRVELRHVQI